MKKYAIATIILLISMGASAQISFVKPMWMFTYMGQFNGKIMFFGTDDLSGTNVELWSTDGTAAGTQMVKDLNGNNEGVLDQYNWLGRYQPIVYNNEFYFLANDGTHGMEVWKTDGTEAGTMMLKDIHPGSSGFMTPYFRWPYFCEMNGTLYFTANDGTHGFELWKTDGTEAGTVMVKDISADDYFGSIPAYLFNYNGKLYFGALDDTKGVEIFTSDGTAAGTQVFYDMVPGLNGALDDGYFESMNPYWTVSGGKLFFIARPDSTLPITTALFCTDGTESGTKQLTTSLTNITDMTDLNGTLYFHGQENGNPNSYFYKSDGTAAGTVNIATNNNLQANASFLSFNNKLYFLGEQNNHYGLCQSDGTTAGTSLTYELPFISSTPQLLNYTYEPGSGYFVCRALLAVSNNSTNWRVMQSNGTGTGSTIFPGYTAYAPMASLNGKVYFYGIDSADNNNSGLYELTPLNVGVNQLNNSQTMTSYPNPASSQVYFDLPPATTSVHATLSDFSGRQLLSEDISSLHPALNVSGIAPGMYLLNLTAGTLHTTTKLLIVH